jgi:hypothetical protein
LGPLYTSSVRGLKEIKGTRHKGGAGIDDKRIALRLLSFSFKNLLPFSQSPMHFNSRGVTLREVGLAGLPLMEEFAWAPRNAVFPVQLLFRTLELGHGLLQFFIR